MNPTTYKNPNFSGVTQDGQYANIGQPTAPTPVLQTPITVPSSYSASDLKTSPPQLNLPPFVPPQVPNIATVESLVQTAQTPTQAEGTQSELSKRLLEATKAIGGKEAATIEAENAAGLPQFQTQLNDIQGQIKQLNAQALANQEKALASGETLSFASGEAQRVARNDAIKRMSLNAIAQTLQGNIALAKDFAERAVTLQFEPKQAKIDYLKQALELNRDTLNREDKKRTQAFEANLAERQRVLNDQKAAQDRIYNVAAEAAKNGADSATINAINTAASPLDALKIAGQFLSKDTYETVKYNTEDAFGNKVENVAVFNKTTGQWVGKGPTVGSTSTTGAPGTITPAVDKAILDATNLLKFGTVAEKKDASATIKRLLAEGDVTNAKEALNQKVYDSFNSVQQEKIDGKKEALKALDNIQTLMNKYVKENGDTGIFTGLSEKVLEKGGFVKDPVLGAIANSIALAIIDYRKAISGAAFTESEAKTYNQIFPSIGNTPDLNKVKFDTLKSKLSADIELKYREKIGPSRYDTIFGSSYTNVPNDEFLNSIPGAPQAGVVGPTLPTYNLGF